MFICLRVDAVFCVCFVMFSQYEGKQRVFHTSSSILQCVPVERMATSVTTPVVGAKMMQLVIT